MGYYKPSYRVRPAMSGLGKLAGIKHILDKGIKRVVPTGKTALKAAKPFSNPNKAEKLLLKTPGLKRKWLASKDLSGNKVQHLDYRRT